MPRHLAVWIDHHEAHLFTIGPENVEAATLVTPLHHFRHEKQPGSEHLKDPTPELRRLFDDIARELDAADEVLLVGPSSAKLEFLRYLGKHHHLLEAAVVGVETVDHPTDRQLVAFARTAFKKLDRRAAFWEGHAPA